MGEGGETQELRVIIWGWKSGGLGSGRDREEWRLSEVVLLRDWSEEEWCRCELWREIETQERGGVDIWVKG